jgi:hypothetical protein
MVCASCVTINLGPVAPPPVAGCDGPLSYEEAARRAEEFSRTLGTEVSADDVLTADRDWLERYGNTITDTCDDYFDA